MKEKYQFAAISGSLREKSFNTMTLNAAKKLAPQNIVIDRLSIADVPLYNFDLHSVNFPESVEKSASTIKAADAVIIVTPEYNFSVPGVLKNAIDFLSRSPNKPFDMKAVGIMGASPGLLGTVRAQFHLRQIMVFLNAYVMNRPQIYITQANIKFDKDGNLIDEKTAELIRQFIVSLAEFSDRFR